MLVAIVAHFVLAAVLPSLANRFGRVVFLIGAIAPAATLAYALSRAGEAIGGNPPLETLAWAPVIGLEFTARFDELALLMILLVSGVGTVVLCYYSRYAKPDDHRTAARDSALLVTFAGAMLGLVLADDVISLYLFWEITTIASFLLVGGDGIAKRLRNSATQALLVTVLGGLSLLLGLIFLGTAAGTFRISEILADPPSGAMVTAALVLIIVGALTKSAQVPFHPWLPTAMVAPTPVSAYLHAAAMVKAGVYLVARFAPGFADHPAWWIPIVVCGLWTMLLGGFRALRQYDLKTLLAYGTVSQLGLLMVLVGTGTWLSALAAGTLILAHGLFKSALFLTVGIIDKRAGTRDVRELSGLGRQWRFLAAMATLSLMSMAGLPPLLGFVGKEAALEATFHGDPVDLLVGIGVAIGSVLTVVYSLRFLRGAFGTKPDMEPAPAVRCGRFMTGLVAIPSLAGLVLAVTPGLIEPIVAGYAGGFGPAPDYHLALWHGFTPPLFISAAVIVAGLLVHRFAGVQRLGGHVPKALHAQTWYTKAVEGIESVAQGVTGRIQVGSLPVYLGITLVTLVVVPGAGLLSGDVEFGPLRLYDNWLQIPVTLLIMIAAVTAVIARRRLTAVLLAGVVGYGIGAWFVLDGGADLALVQFLVETVTIVVFVFVIRRFPPRFTEDKAYVHGRWAKGVIAGVAGVFVAVLAVLYSGYTSGMPAASREYIERAEDSAGATNVVNAIIVEFRALDTIGEIVVLVIAATGAASLILARSRKRDADDGTDADSEDGTAMVAGGTGGPDGPDSPAVDTPEVRS
ncbi:NADH dehydrogenase [Saccharomonospora sp. CUA-673]|uniref:hydrogen gas-evolving membrane-bound hydrogenase subunit E n=1 Tax=Saccharomonospora sp. CUA-673 TaxID=1904969 RepID=UPI00095F05C9|nr:hydrogen gas-evolving membrane-bound hydrogenase subunit E [Saccharomonospora sp. CUA-673]OLT47549.1 NADH dehydrogenase [Saccharomonospora sp. CUA-673]